MGVDKQSDVRDYHRRRNDEKKERENPVDQKPKAGPNQFMPRNVRVKKEEPEVDFKTRMAQMSKQKFAPKKGLFVKKEEPEIKKEKNSKEFKKERRRRNSSSSEDSEEEDRRITKKAKKKLGLSDSEEELDLTKAERDARTVIVMQIAHDIQERELKDFFSSVGEVKKCIVIRDEKHKTSGLAYVEFKHVQSVPLAMGLTGQMVLGRAIVIHHSQAEKNRHSEKLDQARKNLMRKGTGPYKIRVDKLHVTVTEEQLKMIMEPFGRIEKVQIIKDGFSGCSSGTGFVTFVDVKDGEDAIRHLHNFDLGGLNLIVRLIAQGKAAREHEHDTRALMLEAAHNPNAMKAMLDYKAKPKQIEGVKYQPVKSNVSEAGSGYGNSKAAQRMAARRKAAPINTQCFQISNAFDSSSEKGVLWAERVKKELIARVSNFGDVVHAHVDKNSLNGQAYIKCTSVASCQSAVNSLHGKQFRGRSVTAAYIPLPNYHQLFPSASAARTPLK